jgi:hypothetical protein
MSHLLLSIRALKCVIDNVLENFRFAVFDAAELQRVLLEISRRDTVNAVHDPEMFAAKSGFEMKFRDHQSEVLFYRRPTSAAVLAP